MSQFFSTHSIYLHWPFCPYRCHFCPFVALAGQDRFMRRYHDALVDEIELFFSQQKDKLKLDTIYLGGGTPSTYPNYLLLDTFGILRSLAIFDHESELSIEINPGTVTREQLEVWRDIGINRLSIGVQSLKDEVLKKLNRHQSMQDVYGLLGHAADMFNNISVDLIIGLPGVSHADWYELMHSVVTWPITHISVYFLMVHEYTQLYFSVKKKEVFAQSDDDSIDQYYWTIDLLETNGFRQYEISNFARPGYECRHNMMYWQRVPYKGFGLGACSFDGSKRFQNEKNLMSYIEGVKNKEPGLLFSENLTQEQIYLEKIMLGMRQTKGVRRDELTQGFSDDKKMKLEKEIVLLKKHNLITECNGRLSLTPSGLAVENEIITRLSLQY